MTKKGAALLLSALLTLCSAIVIIRFSGQDGSQSNALSRALASWVLPILGLENTAESMELLNLILRKLAHFTLYFLLGVGLTGVVHNWKRTPAALTIIILGGLFAASDEFHQQFSQGRTSSVWDVLLDTCGIAAGWAVSIGLLRLCKKIKNNGR